MKAVNVRVNVKDEVNCVDPFKRQKLKDEENTHWKKF